ncbi:HNH endonuclease [Streptomyces sp. NPDC001194]|uniref:HNH endonuclease n=1 Tax=Streptomyces sp. NPDC001194 TaxID=3364547 RepID=UPI003696984C
MADAESHARNREKRNAAMRDHYAANAETYKARAQDAYRGNPEAAKSRSRIWATANPERRREIVHASARRRHQLDPERRREIWRRRNAAIKKGVALYAFTSADVAAKVAYWGHACWVCRVPYQAIDHVKPLAKGGPHMLANLRPICTSCNTRKLDRWPLP